jgi:histone-lysine N-methyltransferase EZH2
MDLEDPSTVLHDDPGVEFLLAKEETGYQVYKSLWKEFYDWERQHCFQTIQGLEQPTKYPEELPPEDSSDSDSLDLLNEYTEWFTFETRDRHRSVNYEDGLPLKVKLEEEGNFPYPSYTACTPSSSNAQYPKNFMEKAPFIPFADNPTFRKNKYLSLFNSFGWQTDFWDPDSL